MTSNVFVHPPVTDEVLHRYLVEVENARREQLEALADRDDDVVSSAHRASVERILGEVRTARVRLEEGRYGICTGCDEPISAARLEFRRWATTCVRCAQDGRR